MLRIAVLGDIHTSYEAEDTAYFNASTYDAVLIVGDLPGRTHRQLLPVARQLAELKKPSYYIPGNHDGVSVTQLIGEISQNRLVIENSASGQPERMERLREALGDIVVCGYSRHQLGSGEHAIDMVAARPHSMGGPAIGYRPYLKKTFGVSTMEESARKIGELFAACTRPILVLAHNGPTGLGQSRSDIWGCDFRKEEGDFGDSDLESAIQTARDGGKSIIAVAAGHMHHHLRGGAGVRNWIALRNRTWYINAARVPRIFEDAGVRKRHHVRIEIAGEKAAVSEVFVSGETETVREIRG